MKKIIGLTFSIIGLVVAISAIAGYFLLSTYYKGSFTVGTYINQIYATGMTVDEMNQMLSKDSTYEGIRVVDMDGNECFIPACDIQYALDYSSQLTEIFANQNPYMWPSRMMYPKYYEVYPTKTIDAELLKIKLMDAGFIRSHASQSGELYLDTEQGYRLVDQRVGAYDITGIESDLIQAITQGKNEFLIDDKYALPVVNSSQEEKLIDEWGKLDHSLNTNLVYVFGEEELPIDTSITSEWVVMEDDQIVVDESGSVVWDYKKIDEFVDTLADTYNTIGKPRQFRTSEGRLIEVSGGIYGNEINKQLEKKFLKDYFGAKKYLQSDVEKHEPAYSRKAYSQGSNDIGRTYIEVNMTRQHMYYYENGKLIVETPIVTGNTSYGRGTPTGVNYVYAKQKNRTLRGPGYAAFVNFWMPVNGNIGIHDASWRGEYGDEIYKTNGSHGCINTPYDAMSTIYERAEIGTPVIMFYE